MAHRSAVGVNQDGVADVDAAAGECWCEQAMLVAAGVCHDGLRATGPRLDRPEALAAEADGCVQDGAETLGTGRGAELDTGRCAAAGGFFLMKAFLTRAALVLDAGRRAEVDAGRCLLRAVERSVGTVPFSGQSLGWSGRPGVAHATIFRPRARGYAPDSLSLFLMPVTRTLPSDPTLLMTRGKWTPPGHWHRAATPRIHLPMARNR